MTERYDAVVTSPPNRPSAPGPAPPGWHARRAVAGTYGP